MTRVDEDLPAGGQAPVGPVKTASPTPLVWLLAVFLASH